MIRSSSKPSLPSNRMFAVQLSSEAQVAHGEFTGRVEHIVSMRATRFQSLNDLTAFIVQVLTTLQEDDAELEPARDEKPDCIIRESPWKGRKKDHDHL